MGFWDSFQAGFYGAAGVDYYAMQTRDELRGLRDDLARVRTSIAHDDVATAAPLDVDADDDELEGEEMFGAGDFEALSNHVALLHSALVRGDMSEVRAAAEDALPVMRFASKAMRPLRRSGWVAGDPEAQDEMVAMAKATKRFAKACKQWMRGEDAPAQAQWDLAVYRWNEAHSLSAARTGAALEGS